GHAPHCLRQSQAAVLLPGGRGQPGPPGAGLRAVSHRTAGPGISHPGFLSSMGELTMKLYVADAFTTRRFSGNQAGVTLLGGEPFPEEGLMRALAGELKHSETAFVRQTGEK